jgi:protoporphyrinogen/coproporphyrinogen III oxidase
MKHIAIIGAGITGLAAAYNIEKQRRQGAEVQYTLIESASRVGGVLVSDRVEGCLVEAGADSFLTEKPWAAALCRELGLGDQIIGSNDAQRKTFILVKNRLVEMPDGLMFMVPTKLVPTVLSPLFTWGTKIRMGLELLHPPKTATEDESIASLVERHFGPELVDRLADPLLSGIYGADCSNLSARAALPRFVEMEAKYGSLCKAMLASRKKMAAMMSGKNAPPLFSSMKNGMMQMVDAVAAQLDAKSVRTGVQVDRVAPNGDGSWSVTGSGFNERFDAVILSTPAHMQGKLLEGAHAQLAGELSGVSYSSSITLTLVYNKSDMNRRDIGFGFLVPRSEGRRMKACTFVHNKFPHRAPDDKAIVRTFLGGLRDEAVLSLGDDEVMSIVKRELREIVGIKAEPIGYRLYRWRRSMAQPSVGHLEKLARIDSYLKELPGLALSGNAFRGIGVPDCVRSGTEAANALMGIKTESAQAARR